MRQVLCLCLRSPRLPRGCAASRHQPQPRHQQALQRLHPSFSYLRRDWSWSGRLLLQHLRRAGGDRIESAIAAEPTSKRVVHKVPFRHTKNIGIFAIFSSFRRWSNAYRI
jgi:hypothetical protein